MLFRKIFICLIFLTFLSPIFSVAQHDQHSVAREWNEVLIEAIKRDFSRPTVHARNLFHFSMAIYDAWAVYDPTASTYFLNHNFRGYYAPFTDIVKPGDIKAAQEEAISYAAYRLLVHRFKDSPGKYYSQEIFDQLLNKYGYTASYISTDYTTGSPAALGNYIAEKVIEYGYRDGANETNGYQNKYYYPSNSALNLYGAGNPYIKDPNLWQPLALPVFIDQGGTPLNGAPPFLSPEWGKVIPFALKKEDLEIHDKMGNEYWVYHNPGAPPKVDISGRESSDAYLWAFAMVPIWGAQLDPDDKVMIDISPASRGNNNLLPVSEEEMREYYNVFEGGDAGKGYSVNPYTGAPYEPQIVPRGDYTRVLAEFWADGPDSETPPGHWFTILNYVSDHPAFEKRMGGVGDILDNLEWDVKSYLTLGGAVHDAAVTAWGIKGYYDHIRPVSAVRAMADRGQSTDPELPRYHPSGIPLVEGYIELVKAGDPLAGAHSENVNEIKLYTWRGPDYIRQFGGKAGVGWILAQEYWPYQQPTFVTPPFAGYISGHSTFSRAAAEVMELLTGDSYFPGGMSEFKVKENEYLRFEQGPGVDIVLQWAKYQDASDQCSLSRIYGGIHPPTDDIPGRIIGRKIGIDAFYHAEKYFRGSVMPENEPERISQLSIYPNPVASHVLLKVKPEPFLQTGNINIVNTMGQLVYQKEFVNNGDDIIEIDIRGFLSGMYILKLQNEGIRTTRKFIVY